MHPHPSTQAERDALDTAGSQRVGLSSCLPLLDALPDATILMDDEGRIAHANPRATALFLVDLEALRGETMDVLLPRQPWRDRTATEVDRESAVHELIGIRGDRTEFYAEVVLSPLKLHEGSYLVANVRDVTTRKHAELQTQRHAAELEEFAEAVTHDLKAPLTGVEWLLKEALGKVAHSDWDGGGRQETEEMLAKAGQSTKQMAHLIDGLLHMARFGTDAADDASADARAIVDDVCSTLGPSAAQRDVRVEVGEIVTDAVPIATAHLRQVLHNLVANAIRYAPRGSGRVEIALREHQGAHGERVAWLTTDDNGPGIRAAERERVFRAFQRGNDPGTRREDGLGLGLSLVRKVASLYGGRTWVDVSPLGGARFVVEIPIGVPIGDARAGLERIRAAVHVAHHQAHVQEAA